MLVSSVIKTLFDASTLALKAKTEGTKKTKKKAKKGAAKKNALRSKKKKGKIKAQQAYVAPQNHSLSRVLAGRTRLAASNVPTVSEFPEITRENIEFSQRAQKESERIHSIVQPVIDQIEAKNPQATTFDKKLILAKQLEARALSEASPEHKKNLHYYASHFYYEATEALIYEEYEDVEDVIVIREQEELDALYFQLNLGNARNKILSQKPEFYSNNHLANQFKGITWLINHTENVSIRGQLRIEFNKVLQLIAQKI